MDTKTATTQQSHKTASAHSGSPHWAKNLHLPPLTNHLLLPLHWCSRQSVVVSVIGMAQNLHHVELVGFSLPGESFFTISSDHHLLYVSEVASGLEPPFGVFLLPSFSAAAKSLTFNLWLRNPRYPRWKLWFHMEVAIAALEPVSPPNLHDRSCFAANTVLWCFGDTHYCLPTQIKSGERKLPQWDKSSVSKPSFTLDQLRQLMTLYSGVRELAVAKQTASDQIDAAVEQNPAEPASVRLRTLKFQLHTLHKYIARQRTLNDGLQSQIYSKKLLISKGLLVIEDEYPKFQEIYKDRVEIASAQVAPLYDLLHQSVYPTIVNLLRSAGSVLQQAFPIELVLATGRLSISGVEFPSSIREILDVCYHDSKTGHAVDRINAGLSYVVVLLGHLASLVNTPLKHPMHFSDSQCVVVDSPSVVAKAPSRAFPLHYNLSQTETRPAYDGTGSVLTNAPFEQGLSLLHKNVAAFVKCVAAIYADLDPSKEKGFANNIPAECSDNFLWNLQYILLFMTAT